MLTMSQEADFCGGRLRLTAFLRVVGDGMPPRPTRFRRRPHAADNGLDVSTSREAGTTDTGEIITPDLGKRSNDTPTLGTPHLDSSVHLTSEPEHPLPESMVGSRDQRGGHQESQTNQQSSSLQKTEKRTRITITTNSSSKLCKTPSARKKRRLPVNELALLRTTSSNGLPQPSVRPI